MHLIKVLNSLLIIIIKTVNKFNIDLIFNKILHLNKIILFPVFFCATMSCNEFIPDNEEVLARVGSKYLYKNDLINELSSYTNNTDSLVKLKSLIDDWARNELLIQQAKLNFSENDIFELEVLVDNYRKDLYANTYINSAISKSLDTLITSLEIQKFLENNQELFKLKAPLFQVRYIHLPPDNVDQYEIQRSFQRFNDFDIKFLDSLSFQFHSYILSDSIWIDKSNLTSQVSFLDQKNFNKYIRKSKFFKIEDTLGVYLFYVKDFLKKGDIAPNVVFKTTIKNIILNRRKLEFIKKFETDILLDAIKLKTFEVY